MTAERPAEPSPLTDREIAFCERGISLGHFTIDDVFDAVSAPGAAHVPLDDLLVQKQVVTRAKADDISRLLTLDEDSTRYSPPWHEKLSKMVREARRGVSSQDTNRDTNVADTLVTGEADHDQAYATLDPAATFIQPESSHRSHAANALPSSASVGNQLGRFGILRLHAKGGLGQVSLALDGELQREVALKEIQRQYADDEEARSRFVREAEITGRLEHPGVVPIYGLGFSDEGRPFYAMRFIQGRSLKDAIAEHHRMADGDDQKRLKFRELLRRMIDVCNTMQYAHSHRVIHRDLKPANIMVGEYGETLVVDWGLAKSLDEAEFVPAAKHRLRSKSRPVSDTDTMDGTALGTPQYMSPEQASGKLSTVNSLSDIYSLGATLYHLLIGSPAFAGGDLSKLLHSVRTGEFAPPREIRADVPPPLNSICLKAMALKQEDRFATAQEMAAEIERWLADEPVHVHGEGLAERWYRRLRRHRSWVMGVATMVPLLLVVVSAGAYFVNRERVEVTVQRDAAVVAQAKETKQRLIAEQSEKRAKEQELAAAKSALEAGRSLANLLITNAENAQAESDYATAALWAHKALAPIDEYQPMLSTTHRIRLGRLLRPLPRPTKVQLMPEELRGLGVVHSLSPDGQWLVVTGAIPGAFAFNVLKNELAWPSLPDMPIMPLVAFSQDNKTLLTCGSGNVISRWDLATSKSLGTSIQLEGTITGSPGAAEISMAISDDQQYLAASTSLADESLQVECFNVTNPEPTTIKLPMDAKVTTLWFMPSSNDLAVATKSGVHFYNRETGEKAGESIEEEQLWAASLSPDASTIVTTSSSGYARLWDVATRVQKGPKLDHRGPVTQAAFSPAGDVLITLSADRSARLWNVTTGAPIGSPMDHGDRPLQARFRDDGKAVVTVSLEHKAHVWEVPSTRLIAGPLCHATAPAVAFTGDQLQIAVAGRCIAWDLSRSAQEAAIEFVAPDKSEAFVITSFLPATDMILMTDSRRAWLVDRSSTPPTIETQAFPEAVTQQATSRNGEIVAAVTQSQQVQIWRLEPTRVSSSDSNGPKTSFLTLQSTLTPNFKVSHLRLSSDGKQILLADDTGQAQVWDTVAAKPTIVQMPHEGKVRDSDFSADGIYVVTGSDDKQLRVWDTTTKSLVGDAWKPGARPENAMAVSCVRFHPDGKTVAAGSDSDEIVVWNPFNQSIAPSRFRLSGAVSEVHFSNDGRLLGAAGFSSSISIWDWQQNRLEATLPSSFIARLQLSADAKFAATSSISQFSLWDTQTSRMLGPSHSLQIQTPQIDDRQRWLMTTGESIRLWDIAPDSHDNEDLRRLVSVLSMRTIDERGSLQYLSSEELAAEFESLKQRIPHELKPQPGQRIELPDQ